MTFFLVFIRIVVNVCYWANNNKCRPKWQKSVKLAKMRYRRSMFVCKGSFIKHVIVQKRRAPSAKCPVQHRGALRGKFVERTRFARLCSASLRFILPVVKLYARFARRVCFEDSASEASIQFQRSEAEQRRAKRVRSTNLPRRAPQCWTRHARRFWTITCFMNEP